MPRSDDVVMGLFQLSTNIMILHEFVLYWFDYDSDSFFCDRANDCSNLRMGHRVVPDTRLRPAKTIASSPYDSFNGSVESYRLRPCIGRRSVNSDGTLGAGALGW